MTNKATDTNQLNLGRLLLRYSNFIPHDLDTLLRIHCQEGTVNARHITLLYLLIYNTQCQDDVGTIM